MNVLTFQTVNGEVVKSFLEYATVDEACSALYNTLWGSIANTDVSKCICMLVDDDGRTHKREEWNRTSTLQVSSEEE